jgi:hypothetical protein
MNPPRPASSYRGTAYPEPVGKSELLCELPPAASRFRWAPSSRKSLPEAEKAAEGGNALIWSGAEMPSLKRPANTRGLPAESALMAGSRRHSPCRGQWTKNALESPRKSVSVESGNRQAGRNDSSPSLLPSTAPAPDGEQAWGRRRRTSAPSAPKRGRRKKRTARQQFLPVVICKRHGLSKLALCENGVARDVMNFARISSRFSRGFHEVFHFFR